MPSTYHLLLYTPYPPPTWTANISNASPFYYALSLGSIAINLAILFNWRTMGGFDRHITILIKQYIGFLQSSAVCTGAGSFGDILAKTILLDLHIRQARYALRRLLPAY